MTTNIKVGIRPKILLPIALVILLAQGINIYEHTRALKRDYMEVVAWQSEALAQPILSRVLSRHTQGEFPDSKQFLNTFSYLCQNIYDLNREKNITHVAIIDAGGIIAAHNDDALWRTPVNNPVVRAHLQRRNSTHVADGVIYHSLFPIITKGNVLLGTIDIGISQGIIKEKLHQMRTRSLWVSLLIIVLAVLAAWTWIQAIIITPIRKLTRSAWAVASAGPNHPLMAMTGDEINILTRSFDVMKRAIEEKIAEIDKKNRTLTREIHERQQADRALRIIRDDLERRIAERTRELSRSNVELKREINERRQAEQSLLLKEHIIESASSAIATCDLDGIMTYINPTFIKWWRVENPASVLGRHFTEFWILGDRREGILRALQDRGTWSGDIPAQRLDRTQFHVQVSAAMVLDDNGNAVNMMSSSVDITERKKAAQDLKREMAARKRAEKKLQILVGDLKRANKELEDFAYIVSHDLKAPLRGISSLATWLLEDYREVLDEQGKAYLSKLHGRTRRMHHLIHSILQYSRTGRTEARYQCHSSHIVARDVIDTLAIPDNTTIRIQGSLPLVDYDPTLLSQLFQNLVENALKHLDKPSGEVILSCEDLGEFWEFCVRDNGRGIEERHFERIFKIFQTLTPTMETESTGIGLSLVKKIAEMNGGGVRVESVVGRGSAFFFTIPKNPTCDTLENEQHE